MIESHFQSAGEQACHQGRPAHPAPITQPSSLNSQPLCYSSNKVCGPIYSEVKNKTSPNRIDGPGLRQGRTPRPLALRPPFVRTPQSALRKWLSTLIPQPAFSNTFCYPIYSEMKKQKILASEGGGCRTQSPFVETLVIRGQRPAFSDYQRSAFHQINHQLPNYQPSTLSPKQPSTINSNHHQPSTNLCA